MRKSLVVGVTVVSLLGAACAPSSTQSPPPAAPAASAPAAQPQTMTTPAEANPLLDAWTGPYGGVPPLAKVHVKQFEPAFAAAMDDARRNVAAIADNSAPATFENTIAALEHSQQQLTRVGMMFAIWSSTM